MSVVSHAGGQSAALETETIDKTQTNTSTGMMAFDNDQFEQVPGRIGNDFVVLHRSLFNQVERRNLPRLNTDNLDGSWSSSELQIVQADCAKFDGTSDASEGGRGGFYKQLAVVSHKFTVFIDRGDLERIEIVKHN